MTRESTILQNIRLAATQAGARLFRNNVAKGWIGKATRYQVETTVHVRPGDVVIRDAHRLESGLCVGSSDLIGWTPVTITLDMVGQTVAVFSAVEVKAARGRATAQQLQFIDVVKQSGGIAGIARSDAEAVALLRTPACEPPAA